MTDTIPDQKGIEAALAAIPFKNLSVEDCLRAGAGTPNPKAFVEAAIRAYLSASEGTEQAVARNWQVERHDEDDGSISWEVWDVDPASYRRVIRFNDDPIHEGGHAKADAELFVRLAVASPILAGRDEVIEEAAKAETGWLCEWLLRTGPEWWALEDAKGEGGYFTKDSLRALRFARKQDAEAYIDEAGWTEIVATEHQWSETPALKGPTP